MNGRPFSWITCPGYVENAEQRPWVSVCRFAEVSARWSGSASRLIDCPPFSFLNNIAAVFKLPWRVVLCRSRSVTQTHSEVCSRAAFCARAISDEHAQTQAVYPRPSSLPRNPHFKKIKRCSNELKEGGKNDSGVYWLNITLTLSDDRRFIYELPVKTAGLNYVWTGWGTKTLRGTDTGRSSRRRWKSRIHGPYTWRCSNPCF